MLVPFDNRVAAGNALANRLSHLSERHDLIVLGLPRGGVPVAAEVARQLDAPLDVLTVRKLGVPGHPEFAMGAIASGGARVLFDDIVSRLGINQAMIAEEMEQQQAELARREEKYRGKRPFPDLTDRTVILVDDGLATGATMEAAATALAAHRPARIIIAVPVAPAQLRPSLLATADEFIAVHQPSDLQAVGQYYRDFSQTSDAEVIALLNTGSKP